MAETIYSRKSKNEEKDIRMENSELIREIISQCERPDYKKHRVLLIGQSGSGKSSVINTLLTAIIGKFYHRAKSGSGDSTFQSNTLELMRYPYCAAREADFDTRAGANSVGETDEESFKSVLTKLPDIFDAAGMRNANTDGMKEILRLLIGGFLEPDIRMSELERMQRLKGLGYLKRRYNKPRDENKISMVVFACVCGDPIPDNLIKCLTEVIKEVGSDGLVKKDECDLFVLLTKYDKVDAKGAVSYDEGHANVTKHHLRKTEIDMAKAFAIEGMTDHTSLHWASYNDVLGYNNPFIDNTSLKFLKKLTSPTHTHKVPRGEESLLQILWVDLVHYLWPERQQNIQPNIGHIFVILAVWVMLLCVLFMAKL